MGTFGTRFLVNRNTYS